MQRSRITTYLSLFAVAVLIVGLSACDDIVSILSGGDLTGDASKEISIGVALPLTGRLTASAGPRLTDGFALALDEINSSETGKIRIRLIYEDDRGTVEGAVEAFNKLTHEDAVPVILGPTTSAQSEVVFPVAQENQVVAFSATSIAPGLSAIGDYVFRVSLTVDKRAQLVVPLLRKKLGYQRVAKLFDSADLLSRSGDAVLEESLLEAGVEILTTQNFQTGDTDLSPQLKRINALTPDAIFISALPPEIPDILIQGRKLGIPADVPFIVLQLSMDEVRKAGAAAEGLITTSTWHNTAPTPGNKRFLRNYRAKYGMEANTWAAQAYTTLNVLAEAIENAQSTDPGAIRDALANIKDFDTVLGEFSFDQYGDAVYDPVLLIVKNGELQTFE